MASNSENVSIWWRHHDFEWKAIRARWIYVLWPLSLIVCAVWKTVTQRKHDVIITSLLHQNVATSFWRNNIVIIVSRVHLVRIEISGWSVNATNWYKVLGVTEMEYCNWGNNYETWTYI